jgi:Tfp pilus assembly protein PilN
MIFAKSLGIWIDGEQLQLCLLSRVWKNKTVLDILNLPKFNERQPEELKQEVANFRRRHKIEELPAVLMVPRRQVIVRNLELPAEAEANISKVVEYQLANLLPAEDGTVCYDFLVSKEESSKLLRVNVYLLSQPLLNGLLHICQTVGLRVESVIPSSIGLARYFLSRRSELKFEACLAGYLSDTEVELVGLTRSGLEQSVDLSFLNDAGPWPIIQREVELLRSRVQLADEVPLPVYLTGKHEGEFAEPGSENRSKLNLLGGAASLGVKIARPALEGHPLVDAFPALIAAFSGLTKRSSLSVNLLPAAQRTGKSRWKLVATYALLGVNVLLWIAIMLRPTIQDRNYARQLRREIRRLEPEVKKVRLIEDQISGLQGRSNLLNELKSSHRQSLDALNELSVVLPASTAVLDLTLKNQTIEIFGSSEGAAALPQLLDNSPVFKEAEFVAPITRDSLGREIYRIRMKLEQAGGESRAIPLSEGAKK